MKLRKLRRGVLLVFVLATAMLIGVIGLSALMAARVQCRDSVVEADALAAQWYAQGAIELGLEQVRSIGGWRTSRGAGTWYNAQPIERGSFTLSVSQVADADTDPYNNDWIFTATGTCGTSVRQISMTLVKGTTPGNYQQVVSTVVPVN